MTDLADAPVAPDAETATVTAAVDALLAEHDPATMDDIAFRGARFDAGLAWVQFRWATAASACAPI